MTIVSKKIGVSIAREGERGKGRREIEERGRERDREREALCKKNLHVECN